MAQSEHFSGVEVKMEDGSWEPAELIREVREKSIPALAALIRWNGVTSWYYREQGRGRPNEWRRS